MIANYLERLSLGRYTSAPKPQLQPTEPRHRNPNRCGGRCPGDRACCLRGDVEHELCVCNDAECWCHSEERYEP